MLGRAWGRGMLQVNQKLTPRYSTNRPAIRRGVRRSQPCGSNGASRSEYLLEADPLRVIRLLPGHISGQVTDAYTHASQKNLQEIRSPFDEL